MKLHSYADLVTNSSTSIYSYPSERTIKGLKAFISDVLAAAGSEKEVDEVLDINLEMDKYDLQSNLYDVMYDQLDNEDEIIISGKYVFYSKEKPFIDLGVSFEPEVSCEELSTKVLEWAEENNKVDEIIEYINDYTDFSVSENLIIKTKDGKELKLSPHMWNFEATYD